MAQYAIITHDGLNAISSVGSGEYIKITHYEAYHDEDMPISTTEVSDFSAIDSDVYQTSGTGVTYSPIVDSTNTSRGNFKVTVRNQEEDDITFNKLALYLGDDTLFAVAIIPQQITLSPGGASQYGGDVTIDFQLESTNEEDNFSEIFYASEEDYWVRVINEDNGKFGLLYDGEVHINSKFVTEYDNGENHDDLGIAKLFVTTHHTINNEGNEDRERLIPQLCLQFVKKVDDTIKRIRTTFRTTEEGNCELDFYGGCQESGYSLIPKENSNENEDDPGLGLEDKKWNHLYLSNIFEMYKNNEKVELNNDKYAPDNIDDNSFIKFDLQTDKAIFHNVDVYCNNWFHGNLRNYPNSNLIIESDEEIEINSGKNIELKSTNDSGIIESYISIIPKGNAAVNRRLGGSGSSEYWSFLYVNNILGSEDINVFSSLVPGTTNSFNLGSEDNTWFSINVNNIDAINIRSDRINTNEVTVSNRLDVGTVDGEGHILLQSGRILVNHKTVDIGTQNSPLRKLWVVDIRDENDHPLVRIDDD